MNTTINTRLAKIIENKPITKAQNRWRILALVSALILCIFGAGFLLGLIIFDASDYQKQGISPRELVKIERQNKREIKQESGRDFLKNPKRPNLQGQLEVISIELTLILIILVVICIFLYRSTDWKLAKYPRFLGLTILLIVILIGFLIFAIFERDSQVPKFVREKRFSSLNLTKN